MMSKYVDGDRGLDQLYQLIHIFDGLSVLRKVHPGTIEEMVDSLKDKRIKRLWTEAKRDAEKIIYHPLKIPGVPEMMRTAQYVRLVIPLSSIYSVILRIYFSPSNATFPRDIWKSNISNISLWNCYIIHLYLHRDRFPN